MLNQSINNYTIIAYDLYFCNLHTVMAHYAICYYRETCVVCRRFGFVVVAVLTWLQIMCCRFAVAVLTCRRYDPVPNMSTPSKLKAAWRLHFLK